MRLVDVFAWAYEGPIDGRREAKERLGHQVISGVVATVLGRGAGTFISLGSTVALARLVGPEAYGIMGMSTVLTGFFSVINDAGLSASVVQKKELSHKETNSVFWLQILLSFGVTAATMACAPLLGWFYGRREVVWVILAMSPIFPLMAGYLQHRALLRRRLAYRLLAGVQLAASFGSAILGIGAAAMGWGFWALVVKEMSQYLLVFVGLWWAEPWRPSAPRIEGGVRHHVDFGKWLLASSVMQFVSRSLDRLLLGYHFGAQTVGFYERSNSLLYLPTSQLAMPLSSVIMPTLSRLQDDPDRFRSYYLQAVRLLAWVALPLSGFLVLVSEELVWFLLGPKWTRSSTLFLLIACAVGVRAMDVIRIWLLTPLGSTQKVFRHSLVSSGILIVVVFSAAYVSAEAVAGARALTVTLTFLGGLLYATQSSPLGAAQPLRVLLVPGGLGLVVGCLRVYLPPVLGPSLAVSLVLKGALTLALFVATAWLTGAHHHLVAAMNTLRRRSSAS
ncbi:MAG: lipopolysaccharide biosynthesis protein [Myxococcota bacterium]